MSYKHKSMTVLSKMINAGEVQPDVDIRKALVLFANHTKTSKPIRKTWKPRFYDRAATGNSRARKLGKKGLVSYQELEEVFVSNNGRCNHCNTDKDVTFDHIKSLYRGGEHVKSNLQLLCRRCNMEKGVA